jgi:O-antigen ligase
VVSILGTNLRQSIGAKLPMPIAAVCALATCSALDLAILTWIRAGPPAGKSADLFFLEVALLLSGAILLGAVALFAPPSRVRVAVPFVFIALAWHTGFQITLGGDGRLVLSLVDILVPVAIFLALVGRWHRRLSVEALKHLRRPLVTFSIFCLWGVAVAIARDVFVPPLIGNLKAFTLYPLIALIIPLCITTWRQLYGAVGLFLALAIERTVEGIAHPSYLTTTLLPTGQVVGRNSGNFASANQYALYVMTGLLIVATLVVAGRSRLLRLVLLGPLIAMAVVLVSTFSRGAFLGTTVGLLFLAFLVPRHRAVALIGVAILGYATVKTLSPDSASRVSARLGTFDSSLQERISSLSLGQEVIAQYPLGAGWGAAFVLTPSGAVADRNPGTAWPWYHDDYLQLATEIGVLGLIAFLALWFRIFRLGLRAYRAARDGPHGAIFIALLSALVAVLFQAGTEQVLWHTDIAPHVWIVGGLLLAAVCLVDASIKPATGTGSRSPYHAPFIHGPSR